eukprot:TRINITY_DN5640_c0_g1_i4.p2 TRINITY_DN5640_c0_g1~~TRINITY_DN5640_c0_g1_i4.p2  ORF type:complete len:395 (+),score=96.06 TRINITY_DN5640_c0_g1_i4:531-1715(+)
MVRKEKIIEFLAKGYFLCNRGMGLGFFFRVDITLENFTTQKSDRKKGISRMPKENPTFMNDDQYRRYLEIERQAMETRNRRTSVLFTKERALIMLTPDDFTFMSVIRRDSLGKTVLVQKKDSKELLSLKIIPNDTEIQELVKVEEAVFKRVDHPNLIKLEYSFVTDDSYYFVVKFMKGGELFSHLRLEKRFDENRAKFYAAQIILALGYLHNKEIVFRDLKPENILMDENGYIALTSYGLCKMLKKPEIKDVFVGTPEYLPPEVIKEEKITKSVDWWCLGIVIFEMIVGVPPFYEHELNDMYQRILESDFTLPAHIPVSAEAADLISKLLVKDPAQRFGSHRGADEIKYHPWFINLDWDQLKDKKIPAPYIPHFNSERGLDFFAEEFINEDVYE